MKSRSPNDVIRDMKAGIKEGRYKDCGHLFMLEPSDYSQPDYYTACKKDALEDLGQSYFPTHDVVCPDDCHFFEHRQQAIRVEKRRDLFEQVKWRMSGIWEGIMRFHWVERMLVLCIILFFVLYLTVPSLVPLFIELLRAIRGS